MEQKKKTGIFLTGGGGIGAFHIGFFKALEEEGITYDLVCGSSVGSMVGGASTYLDAHDMYEAWKGLSMENVFKVDSSKINGLEGARRTATLYREVAKSCAKKDPNLMIDVEDIRKLLYSLLDGDKIRESKVDFGITTTLLPSMKMMKIYKEDMKYNPLEYILSSIYLPIFSRQRILDNKQYIDIARYRRYPVEMLKEKGCNNIYVVNIEAHNPNRVRKPMERVYNNGEEVTFIDYEDKPSILDFTAEQSAKNLKNGYETTAKVLEKKKKTMII